MVAVFAIFATLSALDIKQLGVGLAVAVLHRRDRSSRRAAAGGDEAARRVELVPPSWLEWMPELNAEAKLDEDAPSVPPVPVA